MNTQLKDLMFLADNYAQECVYLECENQERRGIVDGSSVAVAYEARQRLENELCRIEKDEALLRQALEALENGKRVRNCEGGTLFQPPLEDVAIDALRERLGEKT